MKSIRRLYFYLVAFVSMEVVIWGLIGLLRSLADQTISGGAETLARALALIFVGVPIFLIHWLWAQRASAREMEEKEASLRAVYLYATLFATLLPVVQNILALINRTFAQAAQITIGQIILFSASSNQTLADNLIAIVINLIVAAYFYTVLRAEWATLQNKENFLDVRRLYRYIWMLYGLLLTVFGAQQTLLFLISIPLDVIGNINRETIVNGMTLLLIGTPLWGYSWRIIQDSLTDPAEMGSTLRLGVLYLLVLGGGIAVVITVSTIVTLLFTQMFGAGWTLQYFVQQISGAISTNVPLTVTWVYYGFWLNRHIAAMGERVRQAGLRRIYAYVFALIGLTILFIGMSNLLSFVIDMVSSNRVFWTDQDRSFLAKALASILVGTSLWLLNWRPMQAEALETGETGDHARRSVLRKTYLYLILFVSVIGGMISAVGVVYQLLRWLLSGSVEAGFLNSLLHTLRLLFLFGIVLSYHYKVVRTDGSYTANALAEKQSAFSVLVVDTGEGIASAVQAWLGKAKAKVQVTVTSAEKKPEGQFDAVVLSGSLAINAPAWIESVAGSKIIVQNEARGLVWAEDAAQAAESVLRLAEGQNVQKKSVRSGWTVAAYILAALFVLQFLFILLALAISAITRF